MLVPHTQYSLHPQVQSVVGVGGTCSLDCQEACMLFLYASHSATGQPSSSHCPKVFLHPWTLFWPVTVGKDGDNMCGHTPISAGVLDLLNFYQMFGK